MGARRCALVVGLDGFRPDCITAEFAPTLHAIIHPHAAAAATAAAAAATAAGSSPMLPAIPSAYSLRSQVGAMNSASDQRLPQTSRPNASTRPSTQPVA